MSMMRFVRSPFDVVKYANAPQLIWMASRGRQRVINWAGRLISRPVIWPAICIQHSNNVFIYCPFVYFSIFPFFAIFFFIFFLPFCVPRVAH